MEHFTFVLNRAKPEIWHKAYPGQLWQITKMEYVTGAYIMESNIIHLYLLMNREDQYCHWKNTDLDINPM